MTSANDPLPQDGAATPAEVGGEITRSLREIEAGVRDAGERLFELVHSELERIARAYRRREGGQPSLQANELVHEAYLRLFTGELPHLSNRAHLFFAFGRAMRQVLVDHARARATAKRGGQWQRIAISQAGGLAAKPGSGEVDLLDLHDALGRLQRLHARHAQVVELRYFVGLTVPEVAEALGVSATTVDTDWAQARAWLQAELGAGGRAI